MDLFKNKNDDQKEVGPNRRILLVQDDEVLASKYIPEFNTAGFDVNHLHVPNDILAAVLSYQPIAVIFDTTMDGLNTYDVVDIIHNTAESKSIKIIALTALADETERQHLTELGVDYYVPKSQATPEVLITQIKQLISSN